MGDEQVRIITLNNEDHLETVVRRFEQGWKVQFVLGDNLLGKAVKLVCTLSGVEPVPWKKSGSVLSTKAELICNSAGSFFYEFFVDGSDSRGGCGYFLVAPRLSINGRPLPLDGVVCQTHLAKLLGPLSEWQGRLRVSKESGYNMIHLTPIHSLGISNSSYSIKDHHALNESLHDNGQNATFEDVALLVQHIEKEWGMLTVQDVVWNHAAKNAPWLMEHPESAYNCLNSPHLRPAYVVDRVLHHFGREIEEGKWEGRGVPSVIDREQHIGALAHLLRSEVLPAARFHEFFQVDVTKTLEQFKLRAEKGVRSDSLDEALPLLQDEQFRRFGGTVDMDKADRIFNRTRGDASSEEDRVWKCCEAFRAHLAYLNQAGYTMEQQIVDSATDATCGHVRYERVNNDGPRKGKIHPEAPLTTDYFLHITGETSWQLEEKLAYDSEQSKYLMAFNGWVMSSDPMKNFALSDSQVYLKRQLVCWGDSVKLNYGDTPDTSSFLWKYMKEYTEKCARIFHGVRIDNAHGTPIHVAEYLLRSARCVRPDLFVFAELFTGSEYLDNLFVNRLGITSLIREAQAAHDSHEQGRLVYRYGGDVVGAMVQKRVRPSDACVAHAFFLDQSHDNPSPIQIRSVHDLLPTAAMISMASCAVGSTRGYDEFVPHAIDVVKEKRLYPRWEKEVNEKTAMIRARRVLNQLHSTLAEQGFHQVFVDQMNPDVVGITRHNPITHDTVVVVSHTAFSKNIHNGEVNLRFIPISGLLEEILFEMEVIGERIEEKDDASVLTGLRAFRVEVHEHVPPHESRLCRIHGSQNGHLQLTNLSSGAVLAFRMRLGEEQRNAVGRIRETISEKNEGVNKSLDDVLSSLSLQDLNCALFKCEEEEKTCTGGGSGYHIPNYGTPVYCGLQGLVPILQNIRVNNDLGHPLCGNIREGLWLADFVHQRMRRYPRLLPLAQTIEKVLEPLKVVPFYLRPTYFEAIFSFVYERVRAAALSKLSPSIGVSDPFLRGLALSSISFSGHVPGATLPHLSNSVSIPESEVSSLSAGLPHFSTGIWRNWGRDTFIALNGCYLSTGRFDDARNTILSFAGTLRHGLIPNLLAEGKGPRYNCRDAVWFWLYSIVRYVKEAPNGRSILTLPVRRLYPSGDSIYGEQEREEPLWETVIEAVDRHWKGITFRERNAGQSIDEHMKDNGFTVRAGVDRETGLIYGGNEWNCGTWMDKMGSSEKAGNRGVPASPRDGAAVELQGLAFTVLGEIQRWKEEGWIAHEGTLHADEGSISFGAWAQKIGQNFERLFYIEEDAKGELINRRQIVKDTVGSTAGYTDYQLRCNFPIALAVAPSLLSPLKAWAALNTAKEILLGPIGIKTLDPSDWAYAGDYNNDDDGTEKKTAKGWNYHQGPEWVWVAAYYLLARIAVARQLGGKYVEEATREVLSRMGAYRIALKASPWRSLPELTQAGGKHCPHSCDAQAWSVGCILEVCDCLGFLETEKTPVSGASIRNEAVGILDRKSEDEEEEESFIPTPRQRRFVVKIK